jgi:hypothetical protein
MKKFKRPVKLNLETLEIRVVPSQGQGFLEPGHVMGADSAITAEFEKPADNGNHADQQAAQADNGNHPDQQSHNGQSDNAKIELPTDDLGGVSVGNHDHNDQHSQSNAENHSDSNHDENDPTIASTSSDPTTSVEASESHVADSQKSDDVSKSNGDSKKSNSSNDSSSDLVSSSSSNSSGNSQNNLDSSQTSKSVGSSSKNGKTTKSDNSDSSSDSKASSSQTDNDSTSVISTFSQGSGNTTGSSPTKVVHGKSQSDHKDSSGDSNSTDTNVVASNQAETSADGITEATISVGVRQASAFAESSSGKSAAEASNSGVLGAPLGLDAKAATIASTAAVLSAEALGQVPAVVDTAIPLAIPVLQSFAPSLGLGELAAMDTLAPVASDLIVGFLPVEQMNLASAMQGVLSEIDSLGEQVMGSGAGKWLYPIVITALAATTVFQLATRRRRQLQRQSVWVSESGIWSGSYFGQP